MSRSNCSFREKNGTILRHVFEAFQGFYADETLIFLKKLRNVLRNVPLSLNDTFNRITLENIPVYICKLEKDWVHSREKMCQIPLAGAHQAP